MKEQIYQNGFYLLLGLFIGILVTFIAIPEQSTPTQDTIRIELVKDSVTSTKIIQKPLSENNLKEELIKHNVPHANIVVAQAKLESGLGTSPVYKRTNNLFGLKKGNKYRSYSHWTECVKDYKQCISKRYKGGNYYAFLNKIGYSENPNYTNILKEIV